MNSRIEYWVKIPIGPIHPALEEPEKFIITLDGERIIHVDIKLCLLYTSPSPRDVEESRMPSSA